MALSHLELSMVKLKHRATQRFSTPFFPPPPCLCRAFFLRAFGPFYIQHSKALAFNLLSKNCLVDPRCGPNEIESTATIFSIPRPHTSEPARGDVFSVWAIESPAPAIYGMRLLHLHYRRGHLIESGNCMVNHGSACCRGGALASRPTQLQYRRV